MFTFEKLFFWHPYTSSQRSSALHTTDTKIILQFHHMPSITMPPYAAEECVTKNESSTFSYLAIPAMPRHDIV